MNEQLVSRLDHQLGRTIVAIQRLEALLAPKALQQRT